MKVIEAIERRNSIRAFLKTPVPQKTLEEILQAALRAPSWGNTQPWKITVGSGKVLQAMIDEFAKKVIAGDPAHSDVEIPQDWPDTLSQRYKDNGKRLFAVLGINREDKEKRTAQTLNMFQFYEAPHIIYIHIDKKLGPYSIFDCGLLAENIALLAYEKELGTCILAVSIWFTDIVKRHTGIPESDQIVMGIAIGYPDREAPVNRFRSEREPLQSVVRWVG
jgi:nitroreductase